MQLMDCAHVAFQGCGIQNQRQVEAQVSERLTEKGNGKHNKITKYGI